MADVGTFHVRCPQIIGKQGLAGCRVVVFGQFFELQRVAETSSEECVVPSRNSLPDCRTESLGEMAVDTQGQRSERAHVLPFGIFLFVGRGHFHPPANHEGVGHFHVGVLHVVAKGEALESIVFLHQADGHVVSRQHSHRAGEPQGHGTFRQHGDGTGHIGTFRRVAVPTLDVEADAVGKG